MRPTRVGAVGVPPVAVSRTAAAVVPVVAVARAVRPPMCSRGLRIGREKAIRRVPRVRQEPSAAGRSAVMSKVSAGSPGRVPSAKVAPLPALPARSASAPGAAVAVMPGSAEKSSRTVSPEGRAAVRSWVQVAGLCWAGAGAASAAGSSSPAVAAAARARRAGAGKQNRRVIRRSFAAVCRAAHSREMTRP
nr:hypothetical protein [Streptomyces sp. TLI_235]